MRLFVFLLCLIVCLASSQVYAQKENNIWFFGERTGLDFNTDPPTQLDGPYDPQVIEGSATISDAITGELLFTTDGTNVWNRDIELMPNGTGLFGGWGTSAQGATIIPFPLDLNRYFIITCDQSGYMGPNRGVHYSIVDMRLNGGMGDVTEKNIPIFEPATTERLTAIPHANGCDVWIIAQRQSGPLVSSLLTDTVFGETVVSDAGQPTDQGGSIGYLVSNQAGTMLAAVSNNGRAWLYDFDRETGIASNERTIYHDDFNRPYGACFSPDGTKFYLNGFEPAKIMQFNVTLGTAEAIEASMITLFEDFAFSAGAIRPGPDGKLYIAMYGALPPTYVGIIHEPNGEGLACNLVPDAILFERTRIVKAGLPNILDAFIGKQLRGCSDIGPVGIETDFGTLCAGACIEFAEIGVGNRKAVWKVSDGRTIENSATPSICFDSAGEYTVELLAVSTSGDTTRSIRIPLTIKPAFSFELRSFAVTTDTIGAVIKVPIVLNDTISSRFDASFTFDPDLLEYAGSFDEGGTRIDVGSLPEEGELAISKHLDRDSLVGYMYFNLYWEEGNRCRSVQLTSSSLSNASVQCLSSIVNYELCLDEACGTPIISNYIRNSRIELTIAPNPVALSVSLSTMIDIPSADLTIVDANGKAVVHRQIKLDAGKQQAIDVSRLANGVYFISLSSEKGSVRKSIVIRK